MQIYYYQRRDRIANYGDELNTWLWRHLLPLVTSQADDAVLVGLGTLLNDLLPQRVGTAKTVFIFSTGAGYERPLTSLPAHWNLYCVRGPLTAQRLNLPSEAAITDGAILLRRLIPPQSTGSGVVAFMPHVHHATFAGSTWATICQHLGFRYIDPGWPVDQVIAAIQDSRLLLAEAMHGAITADSLGIPWIPLTTSPRILPFKWRDWCASIGQVYRPVYIPPLYPQYPRYGRGLRSGLRTTRHWSRAIIQGHWLPWRSLQDQATRALEGAAQRGEATLSDRDRLETLTQALEEQLSQLRADAMALSTAE